MKDPLRTGGKGRPPGHNFYDRLNLCYYSESRGKKQCRPAFLGRENTAKAKSVIRRLGIHYAAGQKGAAVAREAVLDILGKRVAGHKIIQKAALTLIALVPVKQSAALAEGLQFERQA